MAVGMHLADAPSNRPFTATATGKAGTRQEPTSRRRTLNNRRNPVPLVLLLIAAASALGACSPMRSPATATGASGPGGSTTAAAKLAPTAGNQVTGSVTFTARGDRLVVSGQVSGLKPNAVHGLHIHEKGDCSSPDAMSAGDHFNPGSQPHGNPASSRHHAGDLPSLEADGNGTARISFQSMTLSLAGTSDVVGRAIVVHRDPDDYSSQPSGNSGPRLACGVIAKAM
jgi:Cu-Zn family superoxide dismutase